MCLPLPSASLPSLALAPSFTWAVLQPLLLVVLCAAPQTDVWRQLWSNVWWWTFRIFKQGGFFWLRTSGQMLAPNPVILHCLRFCWLSGRFSKTRAMLQHSLAVVAPGCPVSFSLINLSHWKRDQSWNSLCPAALWGCSWILDRGLSWKPPPESKAPAKTSLIHLFLRYLSLFFNAFLKKLACLKGVTKIPLQMSGWEWGAKPGDKDPRPRHMAGVWLSPRTDYTLGYHDLAEVPCPLLGTTHGQIWSSQ